MFQALNEVFDTYFKGLGVEDISKYHLKTDTKVSILFSAYMGKKNIAFGPSDREKSLKVHRDLMERESEINPEFLDFVQKEVWSLFEGFKYKENRSFVLPNTSYLNQSEDVSLHNFGVEKELSRDHFNDFLWNDELKGGWEHVYNDYMASPNTHSVKVIVDASKTRVITTNHPASFLMKGLQWNVHRHLKKNPIFEFSGKEVADTIDVSGEGWLLSGDYTNSTDFIPVKMTSAIWDVILRKIRGHVLLKKLVEHTLNEEILLYGEEKVTMKSGQLMGGLLSFPALCILNHCISKFLGMEDGLKRINGDDLLALTNPGTRMAWVTRSEELGMMVNDSKSHFHPIYGTFNSQLLKKVNGKIVHLHHFNICKLSKGSLKDLLNLSVRRHNSYSTNWIRTWFAFRDERELFTGEHYSRRLRQQIYNYSPFFALYCNELCKLNLCFVGRIGGFSRFFKRDGDMEEMIDNNWKTKFDEDDWFLSGNGIIFSMMDQFNSSGDIGIENRAWLTWFIGTKASGS